MLSRRIFLASLLAASAANVAAGEQHGYSGVPAFRNELRALDTADVTVEVLDARTLLPLPVFANGSNAGYVAARNGQAYKLRIYNRGGGRLLAVPSIDGVNAVTGQTASVHQPGYVVPAFGQVTIDGWRKSTEEVAEFVFTRAENSYASRTGRPDNVGVIGLALFREVARPGRAAIASAPDSRMKAGPMASGESAPVAPGSADAAVNEAARLGTGHGERRDSRVTEVEFKRVWTNPVWTVTLEYDSIQSLVRRGVAVPLPVERVRRPFPADGFVPDPPVRY